MILDNGTITNPRQAIDCAQFRTLVRARKSGVDITNSDIDLIIKAAFEEIVCYLIRDYKG